MKSAQSLSAPNRTSRILRESAIVARAISRHRREATLKGRTDEAHEMVALYLGVFRDGSRSYSATPAAGCGLEQEALVFAVGPTRILVLTASLVMAGMLMSSALPALAQGPPTVPPLPNQGVTNVLHVAEDLNPVIDIKGKNACLNTPGPGIGHHSGYPKDSPC
jgi:hypothetical protein